MTCGEDGGSLGDSKQSMALGQRRLSWLPESMDLMI